MSGTVRPSRRTTTRQAFHDLELSNWLKLRGAQGVAHVKCLIQPTGERGLVAAQFLSKGEDVFDLPLATVICDWPSNDDALPRAPSSVRLAVKLLRLLAAADDDVALHGVQATSLSPHTRVSHPPSPQPQQPPHPEEHQLRQQQQQPGCGTAIGASGLGWGPYLRSLPRRPPAMLLTFGNADDVAWLEYPPLERALASYRALVAHHYTRCGGAEGLGGASLERFTWALAIVGSRSLATSLLLMALLAGGQHGSRAGSSSDSSSAGGGDGGGDASAGSALPLSKEGDAAPQAQLTVPPPDLEEPSGAVSGVASAVPPSSAASPSSDLPSSSVSLMMALFQLASLHQQQGDAAGVSAAGGSAAGGQLRMLVPLLDLMNHRGARRTGGRLGGGGPERLVSESNVRWELRPPGHGDDGDDEPAATPGAGGGWRVAVVASADVSPGQELYLCYDEAATNDSFALHYGFLPAFSPRDDVQLYDNLEEALTWHHRAVRGAAHLGVEVEAALVEVEEAEGSEAAAGTGDGDEGGHEDAMTLAPHLCNLSEAELSRCYAHAKRKAASAAGDNDYDTDSPIKLGPGGRPCPCLVAALRHLSAGREELVAAVISRRCVQLLRARTPLLADLMLLLREYRRQQQQGGRITDSEDASGPAAAVGRGEGQGAENGVSAEGVRATGGGPSDRPAGELEAWQQLLWHYEEAFSTKPARLQAVAGLATAAGQMPDGPTGLSMGQQSLVGGDCGTSGATSGPLTPQQLLALTYRIYKKMLLWDYVLAHPEAMSHAWTRNGG